MLATVTVFFPRIRRLTFTGLCTPSDGTIYGSAAKSSARHNIIHSGLVTSEIFNSSWPLNICGEHRSVRGEVDTFGSEV